MTQKTSEKKYTEAVSQGHYNLYRGGLSGKHDNVRIYWEDQMRGIMLRPYLHALAERKKKAGQKVRIVDLGAGTGEALRLLTSWIRSDADPRLDQVKVLPREMVETYIGCDLNESMITHGNTNYAKQENVTFRQGDLSKGFPLKGEQPFDIYFSLYGSFSHIDDQAMEHLLTEIVEHSGKRALIVGDWLGRHSIEWPCYWDESANGMMDYSMSWLPTVAEATDEPEHFSMRFWRGNEIQSLVARVAKKTKTRINILELYDCSTFVGRHVETGEYNDWVNPVRSAVNQLHESNVRTDLNKLKVDVIPVAGHDELNSYFANLKFCWNNLVEYCQRRMEKRHHPVRMKHWRSSPPGLQMAMMTLDRVIDTVSWIRMGDSRANIIEPQLGYALRNLENEFQEGVGRAHALIGIFEVRKG